MSISILQAQTPSPATDNPAQSLAQNSLSARKSIAAEEFRGDSQVQSAVIMSLEDHHLSGVTVKVTDDTIDISGKLPDKTPSILHTTSPPLTPTDVRWTITRRTIN